jgi:hypothetical protein
MDLDLVADGEVDPAAARDLLAGILEASTETSVVAVPGSGSTFTVDLPGGATR